MSLRTSTAANDDCHVVEGGSSSSTSNIVKKRKFDSTVGEDFELLSKEHNKDGKTKLRCKHCARLYLADSSFRTSNIRRHLLVCPEKIRKDENQEKRKRKIEQEVYEEKVVTAIMRHAYPLTFAEHEKNRDIHIYLNEDVKPVSRNTTKACCLKVHKREREILKNALRRIPSKICLACDMWTSNLSQGYLCVTAHYVDEHWKLNSKILSFCHVPPPHIGVVLYEKVYDILKQWDITKKIFTITLDNTRCNDNMQNLLLNHLKLEGCLPCDGDFFHIPCSGHVLNLIVQDGLKGISCAIKDIREGIKYVDGSEERRLKFEECAKLVGCDCSKALWLDCVTRWNSTYQMLIRALVYRDAFAHLKLLDNNFVWYPTDEEWIKVEKVCDLLKHLDAVAKLFAGTAYPSANLYFIHFWRIEKCLLEGIQHPNPHISEMSKEMKTKFDKYWNSYSVVLAFAVIFDPRYKLDFVKFCFAKLDSSIVKEKVDKVYVELLRLFKDYASKNTLSTFCTQSGNSNSDTNEEDFIAEFDFFETDPLEPEQMELDRYLKEPREARNSHVDVLTWWKLSQNRFPILSHMARDILSIPITTVASESAFSMGSRAITKWRASLLPETAEVLITTRNWLYGYNVVDDDDDQEVVGLEIQFSKLNAVGESSSIALS